MDQQADMTQDRSGTKQAFVSELQTLKQQGCSLLVVGTAPDSVYKSVCRQMFGDSSFSTRRRLFVATDREVSTACDLLSTTVQHPDPSTVKVLSVPNATRSATIHSQPSQTHIPVERVTSTDLSDLEIAISEVIAEFEVQGAGLAPAELRVCLDSLTPLVDHDRETLLHFLDLVNARIRNVAGMGHMHLQTERDSEIVHLLEPVFDGMVELRKKDGEPQQRWYLKESGFRSGWITRS